MASKMTTFEATMIAERADGYDLGEGDVTPEQYMEAWAHLIQTGVCWTLQGFFGRGATNLIEKGYISREGEILRQIEV